MKFTATAATAAFIALQVTTTTYAQSGCETEKNTVDTCFEQNCSQCDQISVDVDTDTSVPLNDIENALDVNVSGAKECCSACTDEIDAYIACVTPTICVNGECIGDNSSDSGSPAVSVTTTTMLVVGLSALAAVAVN